MAYQFINVGTSPNDNTGDTLRNAFIKVNNNFSSSLNTGSIISSSVSSSYALTSSYSLNGGSGGTTLTTGSFYPITSSWSTTSSYDLNSCRTPISLSYSSTMSLADTNDVNVYRINAAGNLYLDIPTGTKDGSNVEAWLYGTNISMSLSPSIVIPSNSSYTNPYIISGSNAKVKVLLQYDGFKTQWELTSIIGQF